MAVELFKSIVSGVGRMVSGPPPYDVVEVNPNQYLSSNFSVVAREDCITLYRSSSQYEALLYYQPHSTKAFSLFRVPSEGEAMSLYATYSTRLLPLCFSTRKIFYRDKLVQLCDTMRQHRSWTSAHLAAQLGITETFRNNVITKQLNDVCEETLRAPIHIAMETGHVECVQEMILSGARLDMVDTHGNSIFHYAAKIGNQRIIQMLVAKDKTLLNQLNIQQETALHVACLEDQPDSVEQLLRCGASPAVGESGRYPVHCAMKAGSARCVEAILRWDRSQLHIQDHMYGGTPLHWAKNAKCVYALADLHCNLDATNTDGDTALHIMVRCNRLDCVMALLSKGADGAAVSSNGNNALHMSIQTDNIDLVQALIVFGADVNGHNRHGHTPRHLAANSALKNREVIVYLLHKVGAARCGLGAHGCSDGCSFNGSFDGKTAGKVTSPTDAYKQGFDDIVATAAVAAALTRSASATGSSIMSEFTDGASSMSSGSSGDNVLCLDGGGIRGLVLIQVLLAIEKAVGRPIKQCFDWIGGTSTGGILALAIVHGKSVRYAQGLYFRLKDEVFQGSRPYDSEPLERFMKKEFGDNTRMSEVEYPKVLVAGVLADRNPAELHFFRNYDPPPVNNAMKAVDPRFPPCYKITEQLVWRAARCSGAAPTYFRACGRFLDGGLIANNPTLDVLTEIHEYNTGLKAQYKGHLVRPIHCVVSLGTGRIPVTQVNNCDVYMPKGILDIHRVVFSAQSLGTLLIDQATNAEGRPVDRARAWCSMIDVPYFRLSPQLSEDVPLDCNNNKVLINMLWETQCYLYENRNKIEQIATVLNC